MLTGLKEELRSELRAQLRAELYATVREELRAELRTCGASKDPARPDLGAVQTQTEPEPGVHELLYRRSSGSKESKWSARLT